METIIAIYILISTVNFYVLKALTGIVSSLIYIEDLTAKYGSWNRKLVCITT